MPEGPEIRRATDELAKVLNDRTVLKIAFGQPHLRGQQRPFSGKKITGVEPRGKAILTHFAHGKTIYSHNQLYGEWAIFETGCEPETHKQRRIVIDTEGHRAVLYSASDIEVLDTGAVNAHPYIAKLGIELLDPKVRLAQVLAQLNLSKWQKKSLSQILLDQAFLAGVGNYLRSEILFVASINPHRRLTDLLANQKKQLAKAALDVTRQAYRSAGVTNNLLRAKKLKAQGLAFAAYRHHVFDRDGLPCWTCDGPIEKTVLQGRQLYWCPCCQRDAPNP
jgi:endonuclease VIII